MVILDYCHLFQMLKLDATISYQDAGYISRLMQISSEYFLDASIINFNSLCRYTSYKANV